MTLTQRASRIAERTQDAYSVGRYTSGGWRRSAMLVLKSGFTDKDAETVLRCKVMRWAADCNKAYYNNTSGTLRRWLEVQARLFHNGSIKSAIQWWIKSLKGSDSAVDRERTI